MLCKIRFPNPPKKRAVRARERRKEGVGGIPTRPSQAPPPCSFRAEDRKKGAFLKGTFFAGGASASERRRGGASEVRVRIFVKKSSNFGQKTPPFFTFADFGGFSLGASRLGMEFCGDFPSIFQIQKGRPVGNSEVRRAQHGQNNVLQPIFFLSPLAKGTAI